MDNMKLNKTHLINLVQILIIIVFFIIGFNFKPDGNTISSTVLSMLTKVQTTDSLQNFIWLFTHNLMINFVIFWISYFSFGVIGTLWCISNTFMLGLLTKLYLTIIDNVWLALLFMSLEFIAAIITMVSSTSFRIEKFKLKKTFKYSLSGFDENYTSKKKKLERNILYVFGMVAVILFVAAILETVVLGTI